MKRRRFTAYTDNGTPRVCLGYSAQDVRDFYTEMGLSIQRVESGDYRRRMPTRAALIAAGGGWRLIELQLRKACEHFGLTLPVVVKQTGHRGGRNGAHTLKQNASGEWYHHVTVKNWLTPIQACRTLWHELVHARQAERAIRMYPRLTPAQAWAAYLRRYGRGPYLRRPVEVEARQHEFLADVRMLTARP